MAETEVARFACALRSGDRGTLARAISLIEAGDPRMGSILEACGTAGLPRVIGFTGAPGVGKSCLLAALGSELARRGLKTAVLAIDPSSATTGGAVLGDRIRMMSAGVFIRSLATRGALGGLTAAVPRVIQALGVAGWQVCLLETVGVGQSEIDVRDVADTTAVVCGPGFGDGVQAIKAGLLEIADLYVVNKADHPDAPRVANELRSAMSFGESGRQVPVLVTVATRSEGISELADAVLPPRANPSTPDAARARLKRSMLNEAAAVMRGWLDEVDAGSMEQWIDAVTAGRMSRDAGIRAVLRDAVGSHARTGAE